MTMTFPLIHYYLVGEDIHQVDSVDSQSSPVAQVEQHRDSVHHTEALVHLLELVRGGGILGRLTLRGSLLQALHRQLRRSRSKVGSVDKSGGSGHSQSAPYQRNQLSWNTAQQSNSRQKLERKVSREDTGLKLGEVL